jgi:hypothetical protein
MLALAQVNYVPNGDFAAPLTRTTKILVHNPVLAASTNNMVSRDAVHAHNAPGCLRIKAAAVGDAKSKCNRVGVPITINGSEAFLDHAPWTMVSNGFKTYPPYNCDAGHGGAAGAAGQCAAWLQSRGFCGVDRRAPPASSRKRKRRCVRKNSAPTLVCSWQTTLDYPNTKEHAMNTLIRGGTTYSAGIDLHKGPLVLGGGRTAAAGDSVRAGTRTRRACATTRPAQVGRGRATIRIGSDDNYNGVKGRRGMTHAQFNWHAASGRIYQLSRCARIATRTAFSVVCTCGNAIVWRFCCSRGPAATWL